MIEADVDRRRSNPTIALIGCGAIANSFHLPALARDPAVREKLILVDPATDRAKALGDEHGIDRIAASHQDVIDSIDAAVITVPHSLHYSIARDLVARGVHVLCEKPLTETVEEADDLIATAKASGAVLAANYTKRLYPSFQKIRDLITEGAIGTPQSFGFLWGEVFDWPAASGFYFGRAAEGRGVLFDKGPHVLDALCWWLPGDAAVVSCHDDSFGGSEAVSEVDLQIGSARGTVRLSWLSRYENTFTIRGDEGTIRGSVFDWKGLDIIEPNGNMRRLKTGAGAHSPSGFGPAIIDDFLSAIAQNVDPLIPAADVIDSIRLIEQCYAVREQFAMPWNTAPGTNDA